MPPRLWVFRFRICYYADPSPYYSPFDTVFEICSVYTSSSRIKFFLLPGLPTEVCLPGHPADREGSVQARVRQVLPAVPRPHLAAGTDLNNFQHPLLGKIRVCQSVQLWPPPHLVNPERSFWRSVCLGSSTRRCSYQCVENLRVSSLNVFSVKQDRSKCARSSLNVEANSSIMSLELEAVFFAGCSRSSLRNTAIFCTDKLLTASNPILSAPGAGGGDGGPPADVCPGLRGLPPGPTPATHGQSG